MSKIDAQHPLAVLVNFVVDNDDLLELEERIGRFNIFDALGIARAEIRHSNFLAWLLDPAESHGQGLLFLTAILMDLLKRSPPSHRALSPLELDGVELKGVQIFRERWNIDLLIRCDSPQFVIAIENKIDSNEHGDQLSRYRTTVDREYQHIPKSKRMFVLLAAGNVEATDEAWVSYGYSDIFRVLARCIRINHGAIGNDVVTFVEHYLRLIGTRFMDDENIDRLCRDIYRNHRQALDLIFERAGSPETALVGDLENYLKDQTDRWIVFNRMAMVLVFVPRQWDSLLPPIGSRKTFSRTRWLVAELRLTKDEKAAITSCILEVKVWPTNNAEKRNQLINRLTLNPKEFALRTSGKRAGGEWTKLMGEVVDTWPSDTEVDRDRLFENLKTKLDAFYKRVEQMNVAISDLFQSIPKDS